MEGLIPFIIRAIRKQRPGHRYRSFSESSNRSYHLLLGGGDQLSIEGSSHRRTRSEFQPPSVDFLEQRSGAGLDYISQAKSFNRASSMLSPSSTTNVPRRRQMNSTPTMTSYEVSMGIKSEGGRKF